MLNQNFFEEGKKKKSLPEIRFQRNKLKNASPSSNLNRERTPISD